MKQKLKSIIFLIGFLLVFIMTILYTIWQFPGILGISEHGIQLNLSTDEVQIIEEAIEVDFPEDTSINMIYGGVSGYQSEVDLQIYVALSGSEEDKTFIKTWLMRTYPDKVSHEIEQMTNNCLERGKFVMSAVLHDTPHLEYFKKWFAPNYLLLISLWIIFILYIRYYKRSIDQRKRCL